MNTETYLEKNMLFQDLYLLTHPEEWPHDLLPLCRRGGNIVWNEKDAGIVISNNLRRVWIGVYLGTGDPRNGTPEDYRSPEDLLSVWEIG